MFKIRKVIASLTPDEHRRLAQLYGSDSALAFETTDSLENRRLNLPHRKPSRQQALTRGE
jgi:hypothetical protein